MSAFTLFPQTRTSPTMSLLPWLNNNRAVLSAMGARQDGIIGLSYTPDEYGGFQRQKALPRILADADIVPFNLLEDPGDDYRIMFPQRAGDDYSAIEEAGLRDQFTRIHRAYTAENAVVLAARAALIASIAPEYQAEAGDALLGMALLSIRAIFAAMTARYGTITADEVESLEAQLSRKWESGSLASHIVQHRRIHEVMRINHASLPEILKINRLSGSLSHLPATDLSNPFRAPLMAFNHDYPVPAARTFAALAAQLTQLGEAMHPEPAGAAAAKAIERTRSGETKKRTSSNSDRERIQNGPLVMCANHGWNKSHVTAFCRAGSRKGAGGGRVGN